MDMKNQKLAKEIAEQRVIMIAPLLDTTLSQDEYYDKRRELADTFKVSTRTLQRYVDASNGNGIAGLSVCAVKFRHEASLPSSRYLNLKTKPKLAC